MFFLKRNLLRCISARRFTCFPFVQQMSMATEIVQPTDRHLLFNQLEARTENETFPVRQMLWLITKNVVKEGKVFVDEWPNFNHICCLHPTNLYAPASDRDFATIAASGPTNSSALSKFLMDLITDRQWKNRDGLILFYVTDSIVKAIRDLLCPNPGPENGKFWISQPLRHFTATKPENLPEYERLCQESLAKLDSTLIIDRVRSLDAEIIAKNWHYNLPDKVAMFKWLATILPSVCIREPKTYRPLSWIMSYSCGASGASFVVPEWRGKGLAEAHTFKLSADLVKLIPSKRYFWILDDNLASLRHAPKVYFDIERTDLYVHVCVYDSPARAKL